MSGKTILKNITYAFTFQLKCKLSNHSKLTKELKQSEVTGDDLCEITRHEWGVSFGITNFNILQVALIRCTFLIPFRI